MPSAYKVIFKIIRMRGCLSKGILDMKGLKRVSGQGPVIWGMTEK